MAKKVKKEKKAVMQVPKGFKCFRKKGGGSIRWPNRIIKPGQTFYINPDDIPEVFKDQIEEIPADKKAVIVIVKAPKVKKAKPPKRKPATDKFEVVEAKDEDGNVLKKGKKWLYNVADGNGKVMNSAPLLKGEAADLCETLSA